MQTNLQKVVEKLEWMESNKIWPHGKRYLWTDAFGVVNLLSLYKQTENKKYLDEAVQLVESVYQTLGRRKGLRIGDQPDRDGQYYHYLCKWMFALHQLSKFRPEYHQKAVELAKQIHTSFLVPGVGVLWKMNEDLTSAYPGFGLGGLDHYQGYTMYKLIDETALSGEIYDMKELVYRDYHKFRCTQDLGLGDMLWNCHWFPEEEWSRVIREKCVVTLESMWRDKGYFIRDPVWEPTSLLAFSNYGVSLGLQAQQIFPDRVQKLNTFFETYKSNDEYDWDGITHVMQCTSLFPGLFLKNWHPTSIMAPIESDRK